ncbi:MAG: nickel insertion protein [Micropruina sp.]
MRAWLDVTAGVAGDMVMGALVDAGADLAGIRRAIGEVVGREVQVHREPVNRAGLRATKIHVDIVGGGTGTRSWTELRGTIGSAALPPLTRQLSLACLDLVAEAYEAGYGCLPARKPARSGGAGHAGRHRRRLRRPAPAGRPAGVRVARRGGFRTDPQQPRRTPGAHPTGSPHGPRLGDRQPAAARGVRAVPEAQAADRPGSPATPTHLPVAEVVADADGVWTEAPAQSVGDAGLGELATPTGMALVRTLARGCTSEPGFTPSVIGVGAGGQDVPGRPNVVRLLLS